MARPLQEGLLGGLCSQRFTMLAACDIEYEDTLCLRSSTSLCVDTNAWLGMSVGANHRIVSHLGSGGMCHVFLARHATRGDYAAVKVMQPESPAVLAHRLIEEARILSAVEHPNIVHVSEMGLLVDETPYLLMEYVPGADLGERQDELRTAPIERVLSILGQIACALDYLHARGIVHRDIKPNNIMLDERADDSVKLVDFGIALDSRSVELEDSYELLGTPAYMAPEQLLQIGGISSCSRASDLYAFGALALELLTGKPPYEGGTSDSIRAAVREERPEPPSARGLVAPGLDAVFERALAREPHARHGSAQELADALAASLAPDVCGRSPANALPRPQRSPRARSNVWVG